MTERSDTAGTQFDDLPMRVGLGQFVDPSPSRLRYIKQLGVDDVLLNFYRYGEDYPHLPTEEAPLTGHDEWSLDELVALRERLEDADLRLNAIENMPMEFYDDVMLGREGREEQIEHVKTTIRNIGEAGIPILGYHWMPGGVWRTGRATLRGGATGSSFDLAEADQSLTHGREYTEEEMWDNYEWFLERVLPVAEEAGVKLCAHPSDPPVETLGGVPQLLRSFETFRRAMDLVPSDNHGLEFCLGCWSEMGEDLPEVIRYFGERDELFYVHFRDVEGTVPSFHETFVDEGNYDTYDVMALLHEVGFDGMLIPDHVPELEDDDDWQSRGRAHAVGYLQATLNAVRRAND
jgi:mannonate dehydratase